MSSVRLLAENWIDLDTIPAYSKTSEQVSFPVANMFARKRRAKVWRSAGYFAVPAGSNTLIIREAEGVNLTATVVAGSYISVSAFLTAVKTALDAAGASTYTVEQDATTKRIKITSGGGESRIFQIITTDASSAGLCAIMGYDTAADLTGALVYTADELMIHSYETITFDLGTSGNPKALVIVGDRNSEIKLSQSATIKIQGNATDEWSSPAFSKTLTYDEKAIVHLDENGFHTEALRYWRIYIEDHHNFNGYVEIGSIYLGDTAVCSRGAVQFPMRVSTIDHSAKTLMESGYIHSDVRKKTEKYFLDWSGLTHEDRELILDIWEQQGTSLPFFIALDPTAVFSSTVGYSTKMVRFDNEPSYSLVSPNNFSLTMELVEEL